MTLNLIRYILWIFPFPFNISILNLIVTRNSLRRYPWQIESALETKSLRNRIDLNRWPFHVKTNSLENRRDLFSYQKVLSVKLRVVTILCIVLGGYVFFYILFKGIIRFYADENLSKIEIKISIWLFRFSFSFYAH